jgi:hypothetical protein
VIVTVRRPGTPTLLVRAMDGILGTHRVYLPYLAQLPPRRGAGLWLAQSGMVVTALDDAD